MLTLLQREGGLGGISSADSASGVVMGNKGLLDGVLCAQLTCRRLVCLCTVMSAGCSVLMGCGL